MFSNRYGGTLAVLASLVAGDLPSASPPAPGGHIPIFFGGANQGDYPQVSTAVGEGDEEWAGDLSGVTSAPNPFLGTTHIRFSLPPGQTARVRIFNLAGRQVRELRLIASKGGVQQVLWDGRDDRGRRVPTGIYLYRVTSGTSTVSKKLVFLGY